MGKGVRSVIKSDIFSSTIPMYYLSSWRILPRWHSR